MSACPHCDDTGKLRGSAYLDCAHCDVANERAALEAWAKASLGRIDDDVLWMIYQRGKQAATEYLTT